MVIPREQIFEKLKEIMSELFEIKPESIRMESRLNEDLGLDSIDAIDLMTYLQNLMGQRIQPEEFKSVRTISDLIAAAEITMSKADQKPPVDEKKQDT